MVICDTCGVELPMPGAFCSACGAPLPRSVATMAPPEPPRAEPSSALPPPAGGAEPTAAPPSPWEQPPTLPPLAAPAAAVGTADPAAPVPVPAGLPTQNAPVPGSPWARGTANPMAANPLGPNPAGASVSAPVAGGPRPLSFPTAAPRSAPTTATPPTLAASQTVAVRQHSVLGKLVGAVASIGIILGALINWFATFSAFTVPAKVLVDVHANGNGLKLGYVLLGIGILGVVVSLAMSRGIARVLLGSAAAAIAIAFSIQMQRGIWDSPRLAHSSVFDYLGGGVWVTAIAGVVLALSPLLDRASFG